MLLRAPISALKREGASHSLGEKGGGCANIFAFASRSLESALYGPTYVSVYLFFSLGCACPARENWGGIEYHFILILSLDT